MYAEFEELKQELNAIRAGLRNTPGASVEDLTVARGIDLELKKLSVLLRGDKTRSKREMESASSLDGVIGLLAWGAWNHRGAPTGSMKDALEDAQLMIIDANQALERIEVALDGLEEKAVEQGVPYWD